MVLYENNHTDAYFNLASEQYLLDSPIDEDIYMLWRNEPSVIIGRNQNAYAELNLDFINDNNIKVVRRLTGGGAVFHDLGNINFTFIVPDTKRTALDFARFTKPIIKALRELGIDAELSGRNDIMAGGYKISGNAQCSYNGKIMHHGTLLYSADMSGLIGALNVNEDKIKSKGIKSVRNRVTNIKTLLDNPLDTVGFKEYLMNAVSAEKRVFSESDVKAIQNLANTKYSTWEWVYGESKLYTLTKKNYYTFGLIELNFSLLGGIITELRINGDYFGKADISILEKRLIGTRYERECILEKLYDAGDYISGASAEELIKLFF